MDKEYQITNQEFDAFAVHAKMNKIRVCPICGGGVQFGREDKPDNTTLIAGNAHFLRQNQNALIVLQRCGRCGYTITFSLAPLLDWMGVPKDG